jgi:NosR/NirI family nitrous oxide reductase transcriptional regulator
VRRTSLPIVKEGPWWRQRYRSATWMDILSYVGFKNLLIGSTLFVLLKAFGLLAL